MSKKVNLTVKELSALIWDAAKKVESGDMEPSTGDTLAGLARQILRGQRLALDAARFVGAESLPEVLEEFINDDSLKR